MAEGWKCPVCGRGVAPTEKYCDHGKVNTSPTYTYTWDPQAILSTPTGSTHHSEPYPYWAVLPPSGFFN